MHWLLYVNIELVDWYYEFVGWNILGGAGELLLRVVAGANRARRSSCLWLGIR